MGAATGWSRAEWGALGGPGLSLCLIFKETEPFQRRVASPRLCLVTGINIMGSWLMFNEVFVLRAPHYSVCVCVCAAEAAQTGWKRVGGPGSSQLERNYPLHQPPPISSNRKSEERDPAHQMRKGRPRFCSQGAPALGQRRAGSVGELEKPQKRRPHQTREGVLRAPYLLPRTVALQSFPQRDLSSSPKGRGQNQRVVRWDRFLSPPPMWQVGLFLYLPHARGAGGRFQAERLWAAIFPRLGLLRGADSVASSFAVASPAGLKVSDAECERLRSPGRSVSSSEAQPRDCPASHLISSLSSRSCQKICRRPRKPYFLTVRSGEGAGAVQGIGRLHCCPARGSRERGDGLALPGLRSVNTKPSTKDLRGIRV